MTDPSDIEKLRAACRATLDACNRIDLGKPNPDWLNQFDEGEILRADEAAKVANCSPETIRRRCVEALEIGEPIGRSVAGIWLLSRSRLLRWIELRDGRPGRLAAETRLKIVMQTRLGGQNLGKRIAG